MTASGTLGEKRGLVEEAEGGDIHKDRQGPPAWWGWMVVASSFYCIAILDGVR